MIGENLPELHAKAGAILTDRKFPNASNIYGALVGNITICSEQNEAYYILCSLIVRMYNHSY